MTLEELSEKNPNANVQDIKVRLSESLYNSSSLPKYDITTRDVYLMGPMMGDFFVKIDKESTQVYPMFTMCIPWDDLKDLEIIEE